MNLLVVGAGAMGRWFGATVDASVAYADASQAAASAAADATGGRVVALDTDETFDAVCLAVPITAVERAIIEHADRAERAMLDVSGVMRTPVAAMREHLSERESVSLHPLFAPSNAPGNVAVVTDASGPVSDSLLSDLSAAGNHLFETTPTEHDEAMETVQASAHAAVLSYALAARSVRAEFATPVSEELSALVETVTGGNPRVYREIQEAFPGAERVAEAATMVADAEDEAFDALYHDAGAAFGGTVSSDSTDGSVGNEAAGHVPTEQERDDEGDDS